MSPDQVPELCWIKVTPTQAPSTPWIPWNSGQMLRCAPNGGWGEGGGKKNQREEKNNQDPRVHCGMLQNLACVQLKRLLVWTGTAGRRKALQEEALLVCLHWCCQKPSKFHRAAEVFNHVRMLKWKRNAWRKATVTCHVSPLLPALDTYKGLFSWRPQGISQNISQIIR